MKKTLQILLLSGVLIFIIRYGEIAWRYIDKDYGNKVKIDAWNRSVNHSRKTDTVLIERLLNVNSEIDAVKKKDLEKLIYDSLLLDGYYADEIGTLPDTIGYQPISAYLLEGRIWLILSNYENPFGEFGLCSQLAIVNLEKDIVCVKEIVPGGKYDPPKVSFMDVDSDGENEILCQLKYPTSSVPVIEHVDIVYEVNTNRCELNQSYSVTTESIDCATRNLTNDATASEFGDLIYRDYTFDSPLRLRVAEESYLFICSEFSDSTKLSKELVDKKVTFLTRRDKGGRFEEN